MLSVFHIIQSLCVRSDFGSKDGGNSCIMRSLAILRYSLPNIMTKWDGEVSSMVNTNGVYLQSTGNCIRGDNIKDDRYDMTKRTGFKSSQEDSLVSSCENFNWFRRWVRTVWPAKLLSSPPVRLCYKESDILDFLLLGAAYVSQKPVILGNKLKYGPEN